MENISLFMKCKNSIIIAVGIHKQVVCSNFEKLKAKTVFLCNAKKIDKTRVLLVGLSLL
jgi:hypothetical protein